MPAQINIEGDSAQNVIGTTVNRDLVQQQITFVRGRPAMYLGSQEIAERVSCYVPAYNHDLVEKTLEAHHVIGLRGPVGSGRETTAIAAMRHLRPGIGIRRFSLEDEDTEEIDAKSACGYIVHAADGLSRLPRCLEAVRTTGGYLVVVGEDGAERDPAAAYLPWTTVEHPDPLEIYRRRLHYRGLRRWVGWDRAATLLAGALPADARRLTGLIEDAERRGGGDAAAEVANAYRGWEEDLRGWFRDHTAPHERALLVAAAVLTPGAEKSSVYTAASSLAERLKITMDGGGLAWCPVTGLCDLVGATEEDDRIAFRRLGYAGSALRHALADYPLACADLLSWLAALTTGETVPGERRDHLAETFADLAAEHAMAGHIIETSRTWGKDDHADLAFIALSRTCLHPAVGAAIRRAMYDWSRTMNTPQTLKLTIARVCEPLGQTYPAIALTRLKHLATRGNRQVQREVILAARSLDAAGHHPQVLTAALNWCAETNPENLSRAARRRRRRAGAMLFLELARPMTRTGVPVALDGGDPTSGWRAALDARADPSTAPDSAFEHVAWLWLDAALHHARVRERITGAFVVAARSPYLGQPITPGPTAAQIMIDTTRQWAAADRHDLTRKRIKEAIVIPLTRPWSLKLLKILYVLGRDLVTTTRRSR